MLYFSSLLKNPPYTQDADMLFFTLRSHGEDFCLFDGGKNIWARDYMPIRNHKGELLSFRYSPSYMADCPAEYTNYRTDIRFPFPTRYSSINLDGGNAVFSPSRKTVIISDRIFSENPEWNEETLGTELSKLLDARIIFIESLPSDFTGHADGMVRFLSEDTVLINKTSFKRGLEQRQSQTLRELGFAVVEFPYFYSGGISAVGSYLNYLETPKHIFLPVFGIFTDADALKEASGLFRKDIVPVLLSAIPKKGGALNCISWEDGID